MISAWFPCYGGDLLSSMRWKRMTPAQRGAYWQLICWQMQSVDGHFDNDIGLLSALADLDLSNGNGIVIEAFPVQENGRRANLKALEEWVKRNNISEVRSAASANRWHKPSKQDANASDLHTQPQPQPQLQLEQQSLIPPTPPEGEPVRVTTKRLKDNDRVKENTPLMVRIGSWFGRKPNTLWTVQEKAALDTARPEGPDIDLLEWFYKLRLPKESDYRRRNVITMLNNWLGEIDKANRMKSTQQSNRNMI